MKFQGRIKRLMEVRSGVSRVGNPWKAQDFIFEYFDNDNEQYAETVLLNVRNEKIIELALQEGEEVVVDIHCTVRAYGDKLYNEPYARSVEKVAKVEQPATEPTKEQAEAMEKLKNLGEQAATGNEDGSKEDDIPF